jgi:ABC-2 type transport system permease protein
MAATLTPSTPPPLAAPARGFGSVYATTMRASRRRFVTLTAVMAGLMLVVGSAIPRVYPTQASRDEIARLATDIGSAAAGVAGKPVNVGTLGGYVQWKYGAVFAFIVAIWAILSLTSTLAGEARSGGLDLVVAGPLSRRRVAVEKVAAHLTLITASLLVLAAASWLVGAAFGTLPGDAIPPEAALGFSLWLGLMAFAFGGLALLVSQFTGRTVGAGVAGTVLFAGWILSGYAPSVPAFRFPANLTPWGWTYDHVPLAGEYAWASLLAVAVVAAVLLVAGVEAFVRRDLGAVRTLRLPRAPALALGLRGPAGRSFGERWPRGLAWAAGLGFFALVIAATSTTFADQLKQTPDLADTFHRLFPTLDLSTAGGFLQLAFVQVGFLVAGFAAVTLVAGWASDETSGRVQMVLSAPLGRARWVLASAVGLAAVVVMMTAVLAVLAGIGAAASGSPVGDVMAGSLVIGLYAAAVVGVGVGVGGVRASWAAPTLGVLVAATFLVDLFAPGLQLPDWVHGLALTAHLGQPMLGIWDWAGVAACLVLAVGGPLAGAWAFARRDV